MRVIVGDLWDGSEGAWRVIPTNMALRQNGEAVMGRGIALQAARRYPDLPRWYGEILSRHPSRLHPHAPTVTAAEPSRKVFLLPTKRRWQEPSSEELIRDGLIHLRAFFCLLSAPEVRIPLLGAGAGGLDPRTSLRLIEEELGGLAGITVVVPDEKILRAVRDSGTGGSV